MLKKFLLLTAFIIQISAFAQSWEEFQLSHEADLGKTYGTHIKTADKNTVVLIIPGSGPTDRNGNSTIAGENNSLKYLAEDLAKQGISSLRIDKRGVNISDQSPEIANKMTFEVFIMDAINWVNYLKKEKGYKNILLLGHSQGSLVSLIAAKASKDVKGIISVAGSGKSADELILRQLELNAPKLRNIAVRYFNQMKNGEKVTDIHPMLASLFNEKTNNFLASWIIFNPSDEIQAVKVPILIIQGSSDLQVSIENAEQLRANAMLSPNVQFAVISHMNHVLKLVENEEENLKSYKDPSVPIAPEFMDVLIKWVKNQ